MYNNELEHHGVLGMKWGVRRYQKKDGSLTSAGKRRIAVKRTFNTNDLYDSKKLKQDIKNLQSDNTINLFRKMKVVKVKSQKLEDDKVKKRLNEETSISKRRSDLEKEYIKKGLTKEEAAIAAYKREKTEKIVLATAGLTVAAATAYVAYKKYDYSADRFIEANSKLKRVSFTNDNEVRDAFYATANKRDINKYTGSFAKQMMLRGDAYLKDIKVTDKLKVASDKTGYETFKKMMKNDKGFAKTAYDDLTSVNSLNQLQKFSKKDWDNLEKGKITKEMYEKFNVSFANKGDSTKRFYDELKKSGYDAVRDVNDRKFSGYNAKNPLIVFNKGKVAVDKVREVTWDETLSAVKKERVNNEITEFITKSFATPAVSMIGGKTISRVKKEATAKRENEIISKYRQEHPSSKLSKYKILENYYGGKS